MTYKTKNLILYSQARSGTTALMNTITTLNPYYNVHPYIDKKTEYLDVIDSYYPCSDNLKVIWDEEIDSYYWNDNLPAIIEYYSRNHNKFVNCNYCVPKLENNIITFDIKKWPPTFEDDFKSKAQHYRHTLLKQAAPWAIKVLDYQLTDLTLLNNDNTIVIVLYRDMLEKLASEQLVRETGIWHSTVDLNLTHLSKKINMSDVETGYFQDNAFLDTVNKLSPDYIITYDKLNETGAFDYSDLRKINKIPIENFFENYQHAVELNSKINLPKCKLPDSWIFND